MDPLIKRIKSVSDKSKKLREEKLSQFDLTLDYVAVYTKTSEDFDFLNEEAGKLGKIFTEEGGGVVYVLNDEIDTPDGNISLIRIMEPDKEQNFEGYCDYATNDYLKVKEIAEEVLMSHDNVEILEFKNNEVAIYIPQRALSEDINNNFEENKKMDEENDLKQQLEEERERRMRVMADFENYKKRIEGEKATFGAIATMGIITELLEINDDLALALDDADLDLERAKESIITAKSKLKGAASNAGVETIEVKVGDEFNKDFMEAIQAVPNPEMEGKVIAVISSAYKFAGKDGILRAAKVIVGK